MSLAPVLPVLEFYRRDGCEPCDEARVALQQVLEDRARRGDPIPRVRYLSVTGDPELEDRYGALVPVISLAGDELSLVMSSRSIGQFLDRVLGRLA